MNEEFDQLIDAHLDGRLSDEDSARLAEIIACDPAAADRFADAVRLDHMLREAVREDHRAAMHARRLTKGAPEPDEDEEESPKPSALRRNLKFAAIAAVVALVAGSVLAFFTSQSDLAPQSARRPSETKPGDRVIPPSFPGGRSLRITSGDSGAGEMRRRLRDFRIPAVPLAPHTDVAADPEPRYRLRDFRTPGPVPATEALASLTKAWADLPHVESEWAQTVSFTLPPEISAAWKASGAEPAVALAMPNLSMLGNLELFAAQAGLRTVFTAKGVSFELAKTEDPSVVVETSGTISGENTDRFLAIAGKISQHGLMSGDSGERIGRGSFPWLESGGEWNAADPDEVPAGQAGPSAADESRNARAVTSLLSHHGVADVNVAGTPSGLQWTCKGDPALRRRLRAVTDAIVEAAHGRIVLDVTVVERSAEQGSTAGPVTATAAALSPEALAAELAAAEEDLAARIIWNTLETPAYIPAEFNEYAAPASHPDAGEPADDSGSESSSPFRASATLWSEGDQIVSSVGITILPPSAAAIAGEERRKPILLKLNALRVGAVDFQGTDVVDAIAWLHRQSRDADVISEESGKGVNFGLKYQSLGGPSITLNLKDATLLEALKAVASQAGMGYTVAGDSVSLFPLPSDLELESRNYRVPPDFLSQGLNSKEPAASGDPFAPAAEASPGPRLAPNPSAKDVLESFGVTFPPGAAASFVDGQLVVRNLPDLLDRVGNITEWMNANAAAVEGSDSAPVTSAPAAAVLQETSLRLRSGQTMRIGFSDKSGAENKPQTAWVIYITPWREF